MCNYALKSSALMQTDKNSEMCKSALMKNPDQQTKAAKARKRGAPKRDQGEIKVKNVRKNPLPARDPIQVKQIVAIIEEMMDAIGAETRTELATRAGIGAHTTLTRIDHPDAKHLLSARTWLKLSEATGVPVTFLGNQVIGGGHGPSQSYALKDPIDIRIMNFLNLLRPEGKLRVVKLLEILAEPDEVRRD
jgi:hypothetical protein